MNKLLFIATLFVFSFTSIAQTAILICNDSDDPCIFPEVPIGLETILRIEIGYDTDGDCIPNETETHCLEAGECQAFSLPGTPVGVAFRTASSCDIPTGEMHLTTNPFVSDCVPDDLPVYTTEWWADPAAFYLNIDACD